MSKSNLNPDLARSWREIPQQVKPRAMSRGGRRRVMQAFVRSTLVLLAVAVLLGGVYFFTEMMQGDTRTLARAVNAVPVKEVALRTDGVLDQAWIMRTLAMPPKATLMDLDIGQLHDRLLADPQVRSATVSRKFPATLEVSLAERSPVALVNAKIGNEAPRPYLVARDGTVYRGSGYDQATLAALPWLDGVKLRLAGDHFEPIRGMNAVADLLATARNEAPHLYHTWKVISLERLESDAEIHVRATNIEKVIFSARSSGDFLRQIAQLDVLLDSVHAAEDQPVDEINLAVGRMIDGRIQVPVTFKDPLAVPARAPAAAPTNSFFKTNRPASREL
ncbi:MAG: FtsQ-type POTRA domain-containing protein [Opitutaceae bacterium]|nr:FtsQ-type POTRA domain-containing protein [Cephaloticoccus sp.]MCP5530233.1 FtsQ-type POTRA domain-containing protein [Opitutaceae bacterium]